MDFQVVLHLLALISQRIESVMFILMHSYDLYVYSPLQKSLSPWIGRIPRFIHVGDRTLTIFNANIVTYSRTLLIIPIAWALKYDCGWIGCLLVILHDFLDHVDGIVAKVHRVLYGDQIDDSVFGGFLDAFCDKIVNVVCLWTIIQETNFDQTSLSMSIFFVTLCYTVIALEVAIGIVRIQDYFTTKSSSAATMEGKLKEKLESMGLAFLCLSTGHRQPFGHWTGWSGIICFLLTLRLAYASLVKKISARSKQ